MLREHARSLVRRDSTATEFLEAVHATVASFLCRGEPVLAKIAARLALSPRTLQRRLGERGLSLRRLVEDVRRERCASLLADTHITMAEVAFELGFTEPSPFYRAFKRWTGMTPSQFRQ